MRDVVDMAVSSVMSCPSRGKGDGGGRTGKILTKSPEQLSGADGPTTKEIESDRRENRE